MIVDYPITAHIQFHDVPALLTSPILSDNLIGSKIVHIAGGQPKAIPGYIFLGEGRGSVVIPGCTDKDQLRARLRDAFTSGDLNARIDQTKAELRNLLQIRGDIK